MALLLPNLRQPLFRSSGVKDGAVRQALTTIEEWAAETTRRLAVLQEGGGGASLPISISDVTGLTAALAGKAPTSRTITGTSPIRIDGGASGDLSANRTISVLDNSTTNRGTVAAAPNDTTKFYRGDATWATPPAGYGGLYAPVMSAVPTAASTGLSTWMIQPSGATVADGPMGVTVRTNAPNATPAYRVGGSVLPSPPYTITLAMMGMHVASSTLPDAGIIAGWSDTQATTTKKQAVYWKSQNSGNSQSLVVLNFTNLSTVSVVANGNHQFFPALWVRLSDDGTNYKFEYSVVGDPNTYMTLLTGTKASGWLGSTGYNYFFFGCGGTPGGTTSQTATLRSWAIA